MDIKQSDNFRDQNLKQLNYTGDNKYDYEKYGVLTKTLPKILFKGNSIFVTFLQLIDLRLILMFKYIEQLKKFKHISDLEFSLLLPQLFIKLVTSMGNFLGLLKLFSSFILNPFAEANCFTNGSHTLVPKLVSNPPIIDLIRLSTGNISLIHDN